MDILLERMLSLIPKKEDGKYIHGAKKIFCEKIGAPTNIISEWETGKTKSYRNYVHAVAMKYNVSVEWLKGETDQKENLATESSEVKVSDEDLKHLTAFHAADEDTKTAIRILLAKYEKGEQDGN